nr:CD4-2 molecule, tandem duplicate 2 [Misgurnus anguillicaudatus]
MPTLKDIFVLLLVFYIYPGKCDVLYLQAGQDVSLKCPELPSGQDMVWKLNKNSLVTIDGKKGTSRKGPLFKQNKHYTSGDNLKITRLEARDAGDYSCPKKEFRVHVVSVFADPGTVLLQSSYVKLRCDGVNTNPVQWLRPPNGERYHETKPEITLTSVTSKDEGQWTCLVQGLKINITLTVVGLQTQENIEVPEGGDVVLPCSLPKNTPHRAVSGKWTAKHLDVSFGTTDDKHNLRWKGQNTSKVLFTSGQLSTNYDIKLIRVQSTDAGEFVCTVKFEGGTELTASTMIKVLPGTSVSGGKVVNNVKGQTPSEGPWTKDVYGVQLWVWIAVGASSVVLIGLIISTVLVQQRNKRMKKRVRKLRSMRQPLTAKDYCQCNRSHGEVELAKQVRPVPIPRQQRNAHNKPNSYN